MCTITPSSILVLLTVHSTTVLLTVHSIHSTSYTVYQYFLLYIHSISVLLTQYISTSYCIYTVYQYFLLYTVLQYIYFHCHLTTREKPLLHKHISNVSEYQSKLNEVYSVHTHRQTVQTTISYYVHIRVHAPVHRKGCYN